MKRLSIKIEKDILKDIKLICKTIDISRSKYIQDAINEYNLIHKRKLLSAQLKKEFFLVRNESMSVLKEFENLDFDH